MVEGAKITEHMEVVGSDDEHIGKVDHILGRISSWRNSTGDRD